MWWHADAYRVMNLKPTLDPQLGGTIDALERGSGLRVPASVREWYSVPGATAWLAHNRRNIFVSAGQLGDPLRGADYLASGRLVTETDCQYCCRWIVQLRPASPDAEPLVPIPETTTTPDDDPPVFLVDPEAPDSVADLYADRFSTYVLTSVWDASMWSPEIFADFDRPLPPHALAVLRQRYPELPTTYAWAGNQGCEAVYRFSDGADRIMIAVENDIALYVVISADSQPSLADIRAAIGL